MAQIREITERRYRATSPDGHVSVQVGGDQRVREVHFATAEISAAQAGQTVTATIGVALAEARRATTTAMQELEGLTPEMRRLLEGKA